MAKDPAFKEKGFDASVCGATRSAGVYAICVLPYPAISYPSTELPKVVYIGSSNNVHQRVYFGKHIYRRLFTILKNYIVCCFYLECDDYIVQERRLIRKYRPRFNHKLF